MTDPTEQARNELSAEALAEWCDRENRGVVHDRFARVAALLRAGECCYQAYIRRDKPGWSPSELRDAFRAYREAANG